MKSIIIPIKLGMLMLLCSFCIIACTNENSLENSKQDYAGKAIQILATRPDNYAVSRAIAEKETFVNGDIIHISTTFTLLDNTPSTIYSCLKYDGKVWKEKGTDSFTWPWNAVKANFTAYYIPAAGSHLNSDAMKVDEDLPITLKDLSAATVKNGTDPLMATYTDVPAGSSVYLQFNHLLTKVTFTNLMEKGDVTKDKELRLIMEDLKEQIIFTRSDEDKLTDKNDNQSAYTPLGYIPNNCSEEGEITFLLPALTKGTKIKLAHQDMSAYHSLTLPQDFVVGKHYSIDITKLADNFVSDDIKEEDWNTGIQEAILDDNGIKKYLESIRDGEPCSINGTQILVTYTDETGRHVVAQIRDVDFDNKEFTPVNLGQTITFQGNNHKIKNVKITKTIHDDAGKDVPSPTGKLCKALFGKNSGTIKNLIIETAGIENGSTNEIYAGILTGENDGIIINVRLSNITITSTVAQYVGIVSGQNIQSIQNCQITGTVEMKITNMINGQSAYIGGLIGVTSGNKNIENCSVQATNTGAHITVEGNYKDCYVGGMVGTVQNMQTCVTNLNISENVTAINRYIGGFAGDISQGKVAGCTAVGSVSSVATTSVSVGGFAGSLLNGELDDCAASGKIEAKGGNIGGLIGSVISDTDQRKTTVNYSFATGELPTTGAGGLIGSVSKSKGDKPAISNSFCINKCTTFIPTGNENAVTTQCHSNGIDLSTNESFAPGSNSRWINNPPIYGKDAKGKAIYYLKRTL